MKTLTKFLQKVDNIEPDNWCVDGVEQVSLITQLGFIIGVIVGIVLCYFFL